MNILSLFDGISCGQQALKNLGVEVENYYSAEIDKYPSAITRYSFPNTKELGDVTKWREWNIDWASIDLVGAGFPCQAWSLAGQQLGDKDPRGALFWTTLDIIANVLKHNPDAKFLMENVKMKKEFEDYITKHTEEALGKVDKHLINSALVSAQNRRRFYWTNIEGIEQPEDREIYLKDVLEDEVEEKYYLSGVAIDKIKRHKNKIVDNDNPEKSGTIHAGYFKMGGRDQQYVKNKPQRVAQIGKGGQGDRIYDVDAKSVTLSALGGGRGAKTGLYAIPNKTATKDGKAYTVTASYSGAVAWNSAQKSQRTMVPVEESDSVEPNVYQGVRYRKLTPIECERLQTLPDNFTALGKFWNEKKEEWEIKDISNTQRYKACGNGWTCAVIEHIYKNL